MTPPGRDGQDQGSGKVDDLAKSLSSVNFNDPVAFSFNFNSPVPFRSDEKLIIAFDFGTTFSGIAYCFPKQRGVKVVPIMEWPGAEGENAPKTPTLINYPSSTNNKEFAWGASVDRLQDNIVGVKLLLDPSQERPMYLPTANTKRTIKNLPKAPVEIAADYIGAMYNHALAVISKQVPKDYFDMCQKQYVFSVPAVWSDKAKNLTLQAAKTAGIFPVTLIKEPEAAALYIMHDLGFALKSGDAFVLCDAGGGTVDLISYEVVSLEPHLQVKELVPGKGGMSGSLGLNQRFEEAVRNLVGDDQYADLRKTKGYSLALKQFDRFIKRAFRGDPKEEYFVSFSMASLEDDPDAGLSSNEWRMTGKDLEDIFAPLITDILRLVDDQVKSVMLKRQNKGVTGIFLVGGFGSSQYLKSKIEKAHPDIQVLQPADAWGAIVRGAALSKLPNEAVVVATSATKHYGTEASEVFNPFIDIGVPTTVDRFTGEKMASRMTWFIKIGDSIALDQKIKLPFSTFLEENFDPSNALIFFDTLVECSDRHAPFHYSKGDKIGKNCVLRSDLRSVPKNRFKRRISQDGKPFYEVMFDLVVTMQSALMEFSLEMDGMAMGTVSTKFE